MGLLHHRKRKSSFISEIISLFHAQRSLIKALKISTRIIFLRTRRDWKVSFIIRAELMSWFQRKLSHPFRAPYGAKHRACIFSLWFLVRVIFSFWRMWTSIQQSRMHVRTHSELPLLIHSFTSSDEKKDDSTRWKFFTKSTSSNHYFL
jgi:hypothetical protein